MDIKQGLPVYIYVYFSVSNMTNTIQVLGILMATGEQLSSLNRWKVTVSAEWQLSCSFGHEIAIFFTGSSTGIGGFSIWKNPAEHTLHTLCQHLLMVPHASEVRGNGNDFQFCLPNNTKLSHWRQLCCPSKNTYNWSVEGICKINGCYNTLAFYISVSWYYFLLLLNQYASQCALLL